MISNIKFRQIEIVVLQIVLIKKLVVSNYADFGWKKVDILHTAGYLM